MGEFIIPINFPASYMWILVAIVVGLFIIVSLVFIHHWKYYGIEGQRRTVVKATYFIISVIILLSMLLFLGNYLY